MLYGFKEYKKSKILRNHLNMGDSNPDGENIDVTSLYFTRNDKPFIGVMGEYHFTRGKSEEWYRELCKMRAGGVTIVATYMFWIYHEEIEGEFDFTGDRDIRKFIEDAKRAGLEVVLRIGPWAHGECRNGAFPDWLLKKPFKLRDNNSEYMRYARIWYEKIYEQVKGLFYADGGNIIGIQFENELVNNAEHLLALKNLALEIGFRAPIYTVTGWNSAYGAKIPVDDVVPVFAGYVEAPWAGHTKQLPLSPHYTFNTTRNDSAVGMDIIQNPSKDGWQLPYERYPFATCELGTGLHPTHHRRSIVKPMDAYAFSLCKLGAGNNLVGYYMYHGGTNKIGKLSTFNESKSTGYPNDYPVLNYDYQTALTQYGETGEQYGMLNMLHLFVADFGESLATMENVEAKEFVHQDDLKSLRYCMRTDGKSGYVFINHYQRLAKLEDNLDVVIDVEKVEFPSIDICGDISFFLPFNMNLSGNTLKYATTQPLCKVDNTYFFAAIEGITPEYCFTDGQVFDSNAGIDSSFEMNNIRIVTLTWEQGTKLRKLSDKIYLGENCDIYQYEDKITAVQEGSFTYYIWNGSEFLKSTVEKNFTQAEITFEDVEEPFPSAYPDQLNFGGPRKCTWKKLQVSSPDGFVEIHFPCDVAQIYADGEMVADIFYYGKAWRIPAEMLYGKECYMVMSEMKDDFYKEF